MNQYKVTFTQYYEYEVEANSENEAEQEAYRRFHNDVCSPMANTNYDDCEIECLDEE